MDIKKMYWFPRYFLRNKCKDHPWEFVGISAVVNIETLDEVNLAWNEEAGMWQYDPNGKIAATEIIVHGRPNVAYIWPGTAQSFLDACSDTREGLYKDGKLVLPVKENEDPRQLKLGL